MSFQHLFHKNIDRNNRSENEETSNRNDGFSLRRNLKDNLQQIRHEIGNSPDVVIREFENGSL